MAALIVSGCGATKQEGHLTIGSTGARQAGFLSLRAAPANARHSQRLAMMWQLAIDAWAFKGDRFAESRLPRPGCQDRLSLFNDENVEYLIVRAYALACLAPLAI
jgi:hypothetical protein